MKRDVSLALLMVLIVVVACRPDTNTGADTGWGSDGDADTDADADADPGDTGTESDCAYGAEWVYLVDAGYNLIRFQPDDLSLTPIGRLECPGAGMGTPFSMSVDRNGFAWVLYNGGRIYHVSTTDASCSATEFTPHQSGFEVFGMGFVSNEMDSAEETLFIAGGSSLSIASGRSTLGFIDARLVVNPIAEMPGWPELTGTGEGHLWGFFPDTTPPSIRRIDKTNAATPEVHDLHTLGTIQAQAWAFAAWGGRFYVFLQRQTDGSSHIWRFDPSDESFIDVIPDTGYRIVGAGVSTCAPYELI